MKLNIGKQITIDRGYGKKKVAYRPTGIDEPTPKFVEDGKRGYGDREPSNVIFHPHRNRTDICECNGLIDNCDKCGGTGKK